MGTDNRDNKPKYYETRRFRELDRRWRKKLAEDGFEDIEHSDPTTGRVSPLMRTKPLKFAKTPGRAEYYRRLERKARDGLVAPLSSWCMGMYAMLALGEPMTSIARQLRRSEDTVARLARGLQESAMVTPDGPQAPCQVSSPTSIKATVSASNLYHLPPPSQD